MTDTPAMVVATPATPAVIITPLPTLMPMTEPIPEEAATDYPLRGQHWESLEKLNETG